MVTVTDGDKRVVIEGRAAAIVRWLSDRVEQVNGPRRVKLEFNCAGTEIRPKCESYSDEAPIRVVG